MSEDNAPIIGQSFGYDPIEVSPDRFIDWFEVSHIQWWGDGVEQDVRVDLHFVAAPGQTFVLMSSDSQQLAQRLKAAAASAFATIEAAKSQRKARHSFRGRTLYRPSHSACSRRRGRQS